MKVRASRFYANLTGNIPYGGYLLRFTLASEFDAAFVRGIVVSRIATLFASTGNYFWMYYSFYSDGALNAYAYPTGYVKDRKYKNQWTILVGFKNSTGNIFGPSTIRSAMRYIRATYRLQLASTFYVVDRSDPRFRREVKRLTKGVTSLSSADQDTL